MRQAVGFSREKAILPTAMNTETSSLPDRTLVEALQRRLQADSALPVTLIETHISWVLLTDVLAYKLKKPVCFPFVDFRSVDARRHFCAEEVRLNQRLAPALYLGVDPVCGSPAAPHIGDAGAPIDYLVRMRRFADGALLSERLQAGLVKTTDLDALARRLADFHRQTVRADSRMSWGGGAQIEHTVADAIARLLGAAAAKDRARIAAIQAWQQEQTRNLRSRWDARLAEGAVRECHGDLHLANLVWIDGEFQAFDGIEFDPALRWIDTMSDLAFLTMDLRAHGRADLAWRLLDRYLQQSGDYAGLDVLRPYEVHRAVVRALVSRLHAHKPDTPDYLVCARQLAQGGHAPRLLITHGLSGSGKSTLAGQLLEHAGAIRIRSDVERKRLAGLSAEQRSADAVIDLYTPEATRRTFERLIRLADGALRAGYPVIVDAVFLQHGERERFHALARERGLPFSILVCQADKDELRRRVAARIGDASEADLEVLERQIAAQQPLDSSERAFALTVRTDQPIDLPALIARWASLR
jgi:aminoglycoside phosphotransferase family enzyme/predicted kinase